MTEPVQNPEVSQDNAAKPRPWCIVMVGGNGAYLIRQEQQTGTPPEHVFCPFVHQSDPRMFVKNGARYPVHDILSFKFVRMYEQPEMPYDEARYVLAATVPFDPTGAVEIQDKFDMEKYYHQLNDPEKFEMLKQLFNPDTPPQEGPDATDTERTPAQHSVDFEKAQSAGEA